MTVSWMHRIVRVAEGDVERQRDVVFEALATGWMLDAQVPGIDHTVDLVFRRARARTAPVAWT